MSKTKEELLSEETRAAADGASRFLQWGVTLMVSLQTALYFVRRDVANSMIDAGLIPKGSETPLDRYLLGTGFLIFMAIVLSFLTARATAQYRNYKMQLIACRESGVKDLPVRYVGRWAYVLYAAFPAIDLLARTWIYVTIKMH